jgi:hypothetical protein
MSRGQDKSIRFYWLLAIFTLIAGCGAPSGTADIPPATSRSAFTPILTEEKASGNELNVVVLYPKEDSELEIGQSVRFTVQVSDAQDAPVDRASVMITVHDSKGETIATNPAVHREEGIYLTDPWTLPGSGSEDVWNLIVSVETDDIHGEYPSSFRVMDTTSDIVLSKYGFWLDTPDLRGLARSNIHAERGDARNGMIRMGGVIPIGYLHYWPGRYVDVHWREGNFELGDHQAVERFLLGEIGDSFFSPVRRVISIQPFEFKQWEAWLIEFQTRYKEEEMQAVIFYAPDANKTYCIVTHVFVATSDLNPHDSLRDSFAVFPEAEATGVAPEPLIKLLPSPELIGPPIATRFLGLERPIVLKWNPVRELEEDEYYEVSLDYWYKETNPVLKLSTRETQVTVPETLYETPNCSVFNWKVTLRRYTGLERGEQGASEPLSYGSHYWYFWWQYPPGERHFPPGCPYTHYD